MIVSTSGSSHINYNIIISSSTSPYSVLDTKTLRDSAASTSRKLYALYIINLNNAVSLIYDSTSSYTDLAKVNL
jgi:hypothetical protein